MHQGCPSQSAGLAYNIKDTPLRGNTAVVAVTLADAAASLASESLTYSAGRWGFVPSDLSYYRYGRGQSRHRRGEGRGLLRQQLEASIKRYPPVHRPGRHRTLVRVIPHLQAKGIESGRQIAYLQAPLPVLTPLCLALTMGEWATIVNIAPERPIMKLTFLGKDSTPNDSPTLYATDRDTYVVQGYLVTDPEALSQMRIPDGETVVEVPRRLMKYLPSEEQQHGEGHG